MKRMRISPGAAAWAAILLAWSLWMLRLLVSREVLLYVHPRMRIFVGFAVLGFLVLSAVTARSALGGTGGRAPRAGYAMFLVPLTLAVAGGPRALGAGAAENRLLRTAAPGTAQSAGPGRAERTLDSILAAAAPGSVLSFEDDFHSAMAADMAAAPERYEGRRLSLVGFAHRVPGLPADRVFVTRLLITCCAADAEPVGVLASWPGAEGLRGGEWMRVTGTAKRTAYRNPYTGKDSFVAMVEVDEVVPGEQPASAYLYPGQF